MIFCFPPLEIIPRCSAVPLSLDYILNNSGGVQCPDEISNGVNSDAMVSVWVCSYSDYFKV